MTEIAEAKHLQGAPKYGSRANNINLLRFIAASMVIYYHMAVLLGQPSTSVFGQGLGIIAVNIFFILSGFLIATSWTHSSSFLSYLIRRIARIFPALTVVVVTTAFVVGPAFTSLGIADYYANFGTWKYLSLIVMAPIEGTLPGVFENLPYPGAVNGSLWTLRYEFLMYLLVPLLYMGLSRLDEKKRKIAFAGLLICLVGAHFLCEAGIVSIPKAVARFFRLAAYFFIGVVVYEFDLSGRFNIQYSALAIFVALIFADVTGPATVLPMMLVVVVFTIGFSFAPQPKFACCFSKNDFSYGIYIWAFPVQQALVQIEGGVIKRLRAALFSNSLCYHFGAFDRNLVFSRKAVYGFRKEAIKKILRYLSYA